MLILGRNDIDALLTMELAIEAVEAAVLAYRYGRVDLPPRTHLHVREPSGEVLAMPAVLQDESLFGVKMWSRVEPPGAPVRTTALMMVVDAATGREALLDADAITDVRTGAMTAVAARHLAPPDATTVGVIGTGLQARTQVLALAAVLPALSRIRVHSRTPARRTGFAAALAAEPALADVRVEAESSAEATVREANVVVAATTATQPVIRDEWVDGTALVCGVGTHEPHDREIEAATVARAGVVAVDTKPTGIHGAGDISLPIADGLIAESSVLDLGDLVEHPRARGEGVAVFKSVGFAAADLAVAARLLAQAGDTGAGVKVDLRGKG
ncbi:ornithine cyclodeaminase family protein [Phytohabitans kaempferiae]|uniref:Ornithine cyclodeaminase family protein n=1 Tax=Phytohabitans kaempferiae TaxID=1620943 RepID=A0ABV6MAB3_9ACTN